MLRYLGDRRSEVWLWGSAGRGWLNVPSGFSSLGFPGKGLCNFSLHPVFLSPGSKRKRSTSSESSSKKVRWSSTVTSSSSSVFSDGDSSGSEDTLRPCERPKGESWGQPGPTRRGKGGSPDSIWGILPLPGHPLPRLDPHCSIPSLQSVYTQPEPPLFPPVRSLLPPIAPPAPALHPGIEGQLSRKPFLSTTG